MRLCPGVLDTKSDECGLVYTAAGFMHPTLIDDPAIRFGWSEGKQRVARSVKVGWRKGGGGGNVYG